MEKEILSASKVCSLTQNMFFLGTGNTNFKEIFNKRKGECKFPLPPRKFINTLYEF